MIEIETEIESYNKTLYKELTFRITQAEKPHVLPSANQRARKGGGVVQSPESQRSNCVNFSMSLKA